MDFAFENDVDRASWRVVFRPKAEPLTSLTPTRFTRHYRGRTEADVTEGSGGIWERLHYDWSDPNRVVLTTTDSNVWGGASAYTYTFTRQPNGTADIDVVVVREGKNLKGRMLGFGLRTIGRRFLEKPVENSVQSHRSPRLPSQSGENRISSSG